MSWCALGVKCPFWFTWFIFHRLAPRRKEQLYTGGGTTSCLPFNKTFYNRRPNSICLAHCLNLGAFPKQCKPSFGVQPHYSFFSWVQLFLIICVYLLFRGLWTRLLSPLLSTLSSLHGTFFMLYTSFITFVCLLNIYINLSIYLLSIPHTVFKLTAFHCFYLCDLQSFLSTPCRSIHLFHFQGLKCFFFVVVFVCTGDLRQVH